MTEQKQEIEVQRSATENDDNPPPMTTGSTIVKGDMPHIMNLSGRRLEDDDDIYGSCFTQLPRKRGMYLVIYVSMAVCVVFIVITSLLPEPVGLLSRDCPCRGGIQQCICPRPTVEALTAFEIFCLANSRVAAYVLYPLYLLMFLTMSHNINTYLKTTIVSEFFQVEAMHELHFWAGTTIGVVIMWHGLWHLIRWGVQGHIIYTVDTQTGLTGLIALIVTPIIVWPMRLASLKLSIPYEVRKSAHYLSWVWMVLLAAHAPARNVKYIVGTPLAIYWLDWLYGWIRSTYLIESAKFVRMESGIMIRFQKPKGFHGEGGYCYLCAPWISKFEWHAFSMFQDPTDTNMLCFMIAMTGDWTKALHTAIHEPLHRRLWVNGPVASPFETATDSDQVISVASGIGITAALSVITSHADTRKMHLIWSVRDASLLEFVIDYGARFDEDSYNFIFYTGKRELIFRRTIPHSVFLLTGRPDLDQVISAIVAASQEGVRVKLPQEMGINNPKVKLPRKDLESASSAQHLFHVELERLLMTYTGEELFTAAVRRSHLDVPGVSYDGLRNLVSDIFWRKLSDEQLRVVFSHVDKDKTGIINVREFEAFLDEMKELGNVNRMEALPSGDDDAEEIDFSYHKDAKAVGEVKFEHFRIMYCGGSLPVVKALKDVSTAHKIPLELENFSW